MGPHQRFPTRIYRPLKIEPSKPTHVAQPTRPEWAIPMKPISEAMLTCPPTVVKLENNQPSFGPVRGPPARPPSPVLPYTLPALERESNSKPPQKWSDLVKPSCKSG